MRRVGTASLAILLTAAGAARADEPVPPPQAPPPANEVAPSQIDLEKDKTSTALGAEEGAPPLEAPPPPPYKKTLVLDSSIGAMAFLGQFGNVAPPGPWLHTQLGYEVLSWLMVFGEGDLAFTDTSGSQAPPRTRGFPVFGFGGGARFTARFTPRFGLYGQASIGLMKADIRTNALGIIGFADAESLGVYAGGRIGLEWYQLDRHFALGVTAGIRHAGGFQRRGAGSDTPLVFDAGPSLRYAF
jgi:hypothetical protein